MPARSFDSRTSATLRNYLMQRRHLKAGKSPGRDHGGIRPFIRAISQRICPRVAEDGGLSLWMTLHVACNVRSRSDKLSSVESIS